MNKETLLDDISAQVKICKKCRLYKTALHGVPGEGNVNSKIIFIGEAPGETEDKTGRPFVGRAGRLLEALLDSIGLKRSDVWIGNIVKHRPPENRDPLPDEIAACSPYLASQIEILKPLLIVTLGRFSMNFYLPEGKISRDHGKLVKTNGYNIFPVYHPAAALRNPQFAADLKKDFLKIPQVVKTLENASNRN